MPLRAARATRRVLVRAAEAMLAGGPDSLQRVKWFLLLTLGGTGAVIVTICVLLLLVQHRLRRRNRVLPAAAGTAPMFWLVSPQSPARLHRRLVAAARVAQAVAERHRPTGRRARRQEPPTIVGLCEQLEAHAASIDSHLPLVAHHPPARRREVLRQLTRNVDELERTAARLSVMSAEISAPTVLAGHVDTMAELGTKLDTLEAAHASLREIESDVGVTTAPRWTPQPQPQPPPLALPEQQPQALPPPQPRSEAVPAPEPQPEPLSVQEPAAQPDTQALR